MVLYMYKCSNIISDFYIKEIYNCGLNISLNQWWKMPPKHTFAPDPEDLNRL